MLIGSTLLFKVDSRFSSALLTGTFGPLLHVQRATIAATCVLICSERHSLMPLFQRPGTRGLGVGQETQLAVARRAHDAALNCRIVSARREIRLRRDKTGYGGSHSYCYFLFD